MSFVLCDITIQKHCPSLRGTSAVSRANGTEGVTRMHPKIT